MMRPHCDRCDALCDECQTWVEVEPPLVVTPHVMNQTWHIEISVGSLVRGQMFCRACRIAILEASVKALKMMKALSGGHLADCRWDSHDLEYVCADGCEIKRMNEIKP